jgi:hypothetical protein
MAQKILQINAKLVVPPEEFEKDNGAGSALDFKNLNIPGLLWKIGYINRETMRLYAPMLRDRLSPNCVTIRCGLACALMSWIYWLNFPR